MRTNLTKEQVTAIITKHFTDQDAEVNFLYHGIGDDGSYSGCLVDHDIEVDLPDTEE